MMTNIESMTYLLKDKYKNIIQCRRDMVSEIKNLRPDCEQLLNNKSLWALDMNELKEVIINEELNRLTITEIPIEQNFCKYFIKTKLMRKYF
jgi:hypothetical protein